MRDLRFSLFFGDREKRGWDEMAGFKKMRGDGILKNE